MSPSERNLEIRARPALLAGGLRRLSQAIDADLVNRFAAALRGTGNATMSIARDKIGGVQGAKRGITQSARWRDAGAGDIRTVSSRPSEKVRPAVNSLGSKSLGIAAHRARSEAPRMSALCQVALCDAAIGPAARGSSEHLSRRPAAQQIVGLEPHATSDEEVGVRGDGGLHRCEGLPDAVALGLARAGSLVLGLATAGHLLALHGAGDVAILSELSGIAAGKRITAPLSALAVATATCQGQGGGLAPCGLRAGAWKVARRRAPSWVLATQDGGEAIDLGLRVVVRESAAVASRARSGRGGRCTAGAVKPCRTTTLMVQWVRRAGAGGNAANVGGCK
eukprot:CAMPEP_0176225134 /NCGR_PEP_ID=MMETSP0121_2-20121125/21607_1 /TAXON_ID=160619 /ORGANISM="Kryptoperidinium foliaceum, Strain CCMP 1326" /LENGTH=336 /DNA_ID=CAMNT_0017564397 /DNA_START=40 /DNA_END=1048 /DNA_ORIENTATION=+